MSVNATVLKMTKRVSFNPKSKKHRDDYKYYLQNGRWPEGSTCPFQVEWPSPTVEHTINKKLVNYVLGIE